MPCGSGARARGAVAGVDPPRARLRHHRRARAAPQRREEARSRWRHRGRGTLFAPAPPRRSAASPAQVAKKRFAPLAPGGAGPATGGDAIGELSRLLKREDAPAVHVDVGQRLKEIRFENLSPALWPRRVPAARRRSRRRRGLRARDRTARVDGLASEIAKLEKKGLAKPFICADLRQWIPLGIEPARNDWRADGESALSWNHWHLAFDACHSAGEGRAPHTRSRQFRQVRDCRGHDRADGLRRGSGAQAELLKGTLVPPLLLASALSASAQVALNAPLGGRKSHLGLLYDSMSRRDWAEKSAAGIPGFQARHRSVGPRRRARPAHRRGRSTRPR